MTEDAVTMCHPSLGSRGVGDGTPVAVLKRCNGEKNCVDAVNAKLRAAQNKIAANYSPKFGS